MPTELALRARDVENASLQLAEPRLGVLGLQVGASDAPAQFVQLNYRGLDPAPDVEDPSFAGRRERGSGDVADVDVVPSLEPVAEDSRALPSCKPPEED